jgi:hypothetical protein
MLRAEYMANYTAGPEGTALHRRYYAQYVTRRVWTAVFFAFGRERLLKSATSGREAFNDIPLEKWDALASSCHGVDELLRANGDSPSPSSYVCILKEAARQIVEDPLPPLGAVTDEETDDARRTAKPVDYQGLLEGLLALVHDDGGEHTRSLGVTRSVYDARERVLRERRELVEAKRELLALRMRTGGFTL